MRAALLPDPSREPATAALAALSALRPRDVMAAGGGALVHPVDLRHYCGYDGGGGSGSAGGGSASSGSTGSAGARRCCFFSGRQCARCQALTAAAERAPLEERLEACRASVRRYLPAVAGGRGGGRSGGASSGGGASALPAAPALTAEQAEELLEGARLYALERAWWHDGGLAGGDGSGGAAAAAAADERRQRLLRPLRDVAALAAVQREQGELGAAEPAWRAEYFEDMALDALEAALGGGGSGGSDGDDQQQQEGSGARATAGAGDYEFEPEAYEALAAAAEALLAEQFAAAQGLALRAGRQEVAPADLRAALRLSGLGHLVLPRGAEGDDAEERTLPGLL